MNKKKQSQNTNLASPVVEIFHELTNLIIDALRLLFKELFTFILKKMKMTGHEDILITKKHIVSLKTSLEDMTIGYSASHKRDLH